MSTERKSPPLAELPREPAVALEALRASGIELGAFVSLTPAETVAWEQIGHTLRWEHARIYDQAQPHANRAIAGLFSILKEVLPVQSQDILTQPERLMPLAAHFLGAVGTLAGQVTDPVRMALRPQTAKYRKIKGPRPPVGALLRVRAPFPLNDARRANPSPEPELKPSASNAPETPLPAVPAIPASAPAATVTRHEAAPRTNPRDPLSSEPATLLAAIRAAGKAHLFRPAAGADRALIQSLSEAVTHMSGREPEAALALAQQFVRSYTRYIRYITQRKEPIQPSDLLPHLRHYIDETDKLVAAGVPQPHKWARAYSAEEIAALRAQWVEQKGFSGREFETLLRSTALNLEQQLATRHRRTTILHIDIEHIGRTTSPLDDTPTVLLQKIRAARLAGHILLTGKVVWSHAVNIAVFAEVARAHTTYHPHDAGQVAYDYITALSRYTKRKLGAPNLPDMTPMRLAPHFHRYLKDVIALRELNVPHAHRRALAYSPRQLLNRQEYWVNRRGMPAWVFEGVLASKRVNIDGSMRYLYDRFGTDVPSLPWLRAPDSLQQPVGDSATLESYLPGPETTQPENVMLDYAQRKQDMRKISTLLQCLSQNEALAVALTYNLAVTSSADIAQVARALGIPTGQLQAHVATVIIPKLQAAAQRP